MLTMPLKYLSRRSDEEEFPPYTDPVLPRKFCPCVPLCRQTGGKVNRSTLETGDREASKHQRDLAVKRKGQKQGLHMMGLFGNGPVGEYRKWVKHIGLCPRIEFKLDIRFIAFLELNTFLKSNVSFILT